MHVLRRSNLLQNDSADAILKSQAIKFIRVPMSISSTEQFLQHVTIYCLQHILVFGLLDYGVAYASTNVDLKRLRKSESWARIQKRGRCP